MKETKKDLCERIIVAIDTYFSQEINDYIEDIKNNRSALINLAITLKCWANPKSPFYKVKLDKQELTTNFNYIQQILETPRKLLSQDPFIIREDELIIRDLVTIKLNTIADKIINDFNLPQELNLYINTQSNRAAINEYEWWNQKSDAEKQAIKQHYQSLTQAQKNQLHSYTDERRNIYRTYSTPFYYYPFYFDYFWMCHYHAHLTYCVYEPVIVSLAKLTVASVSAATHAAGGLTHAISHSVIPPVITHSTGHTIPQHSNKISGEAVGILGLIALASSGLVAGLYAAKKAYNSIVNFFTGKKMLRSLFRLGGISAGGYGGLIYGGMIGALLGSMVPGIGTAIGGILGMIFGAGLGSGLGALITKYLAKLLSAIYFENEMNPSNPEKYKLSPQQIENLQKYGFDIDAINRLIRAIKTEKDKINLWGSLPFTSERENKNQFNELLKMVKNGELEGTIQLGDTIYDPLSNQPTQPLFSTAVMMNQTGGSKNYSNQAPHTTPSPGSYPVEDDYIPSYVQRDMNRDDPLDPIYRFG